MYRVGLEFLTGFIRTPLPVHITSKLSHVAEPPVRVFMNREILTENLIDLLSQDVKCGYFLSITLNIGTEHFHPFLYNTL